jgi:uncharacterized protein YndB with AHSA1/START domain
MTTAADTIVQEITIEAPAARVFDAFANAGERVQWWNVPGRFRTTHVDSDLRPGGEWIMTGTRADGGPFTIKGKYLKVERPALLEFTWLPDWQPDATETTVRVEFVETNGKTRVRLTHSGLATESSRASHRGWPQILGLLRDFVERGGEAG